LFILVAELFGGSVDLTIAAVIDGIVPDMGGAAAAYMLAADSPCQRARLPRCYMSAEISRG